MSDEHSDQTSSAGPATGAPSTGQPLGAAPGAAALASGPELARQLAGLAREALEVSVGLGVLGLLRYRAERPRLEAELERLGWAPAAELSRRTGTLLERGVLRLVGMG